MKRSDDIGSQDPFSEEIGCLDIRVWAQPMAGIGVHAEPSQAIVVNKPTPEQQGDNIAMGASALILEIVISMVIATVVKITSDTIPVSFFLLFRYVFSLPILFLIGIHQRGRNLFHVANVNALMLRCVFGLVGLSSWLFAVANIELTKATALGQTMTVFITILAPIILGEHVGFRRWTAVLIGLAGALILLQPGTEGWLEYGVIYAIAAPFFAALMFIFLRKLGRTDSPATTAIWYNLFGTAVFAFWVALEPPELAMTGTDIALMVGTGLLAGFQQFTMALSHKLAPATVLAPLHYLAVPMSIGIGILLFNESITLEFFLGTSIIVGSSYYILLRERSPRRRSR